MAGDDEFQALFDRFKATGGDPRWGAAQREGNPAVPLVVAAAPERQSGERKDTQRLVPSGHALGAALA